LNDREGEMRATLNWILGKIGCEDGRQEEMAQDHV
jgi:hypothetical protein